MRRCFGFPERLKAAGGTAELHVSLYAREEFRLEFPPESLVLLGRLGLTVALEIIPNSQVSSAAASH
jgi:hypothetical protein